MYSSSVDEREREEFFLYFHEIEIIPRLIQKLLTDILESKKVTQSEYQKAKKLNEREKLRKIPKRGSQRRY